jgi:hypothetical protein
LQPRPFPTYGPNDVDPDAEKVGQVGAHAITDSVARPGHARTSSHGQLADPSPLEEKSNPFADNQRREKNPFSD